MIRRLHAHVRSESGVALTYLLAALLGLVVNLVALGLRYGWDQPQAVLIRDCVTKSKAAAAAIQQTLAGDSNGTVTIDDPNAVVLQRCQALAEQLKNDPAFGSKAGALGRLVNSSLSSVGRCEILEPTTPTVHIAGRDFTIPVIATIPVGSFSNDFAAQASLTGVSAAVGLTRKTGSDGVTTWSGNLAVSGASSQNVDDGATSNIVLTAAGTAVDGAAGEEKPIGPLPDGTCPFGLVRAGNVCRITCSVSKEAITWKKPPPIEAALTAQVTDDAHATLTWQTKNATKATLRGGGIPGTLTVPASSSLPVGRLTKDDTYTLTASAPDVSDKTATATVPAAVGTFIVTLSAGAGGDVVTESSVTVGGKVSMNPPGPIPPGTVVAVGVNGNVVARVGVDAGGLYTANITLPRTTSVGSLVLTNPARSLTVCGSHPASVVTLANNASPAAVQNFVNAAVAKADGGIASNDASLVITHAVKILSATVTWSGSCSDSNDSFSVAGKILRQGDSTQLGIIPCGITCPSSGLSCSPVARVSVSTSVGSLFQDAVWTVNIP